MATASLTGSLSGPRHGGATATELIPLRSPAISINGALLIPDADGKSAAKTEAVIGGTERFFVLWRCGSDALTR